MKMQDNSRGWPEGWIAAAAAGVFAAVIARLVGDLGLVSTLFVGVFVFLVFGVILGMFWGTGTLPTADGHGDTSHGHSSNAPVVAAAPSPAQVVASAAIAVEDATPTEAMPHPAIAAPEAEATDDGMAEAPAAEALMAAPESDGPPETVAGVETEQGTEMAEGTEGVEPSAMPAPVAMDETSKMTEFAESAEPPSMAAPVAMAEEAEPAEIAESAEPPAMAESAEPAAMMEPAAVPEPEAMSAPSAFADLPPVAAAEAGGAKPVGLTGPRDGIADKLQTIEGIGPVLEKLCHDLGIYHFDQIAGWDTPEIAWMDGNLKGFKGRVSRDRWVAQAKLIGEVGIEEFARRAKTNDY